MGLCGHPDDFLEVLNSLGFGATTSNSQGLFLPLNLGITPGELGGTYGILGSNPDRPLASLVPYLLYYLSGPFSFNILREFSMEKRSYLP